MKQIILSHAPEKKIQQRVDRPKLFRYMKRAVVALVLAPLVIIPVAVMAVVAGPPIKVPVDGSVGNGTDTVAFSGDMSIATRLIDDPVFNGPRLLELVVDFSNVKGVGKGAGQAAFTSTAQAIVHRPLLAFDPIEITFPYTPGNNASASLTAKATINVSFNATSGLAMTSKITNMPAN